MARIEDVWTLADAKMLGEKIVRSAWNHGFAADQHVDAIGRLLARVHTLAVTQAGGPGRREGDELPLRACQEGPRALPAG